MSNNYSYPPNFVQPTNPQHPQQRAMNTSHGYSHRSQGQPSVEGRGRGQAPQRQDIQQQLPPLRQPQQPTLNLNRDFTSAEELLTTLQQFNQSYDIFNNFEIPSASFPGDIPQGGVGNINMSSVTSSVDYDNDESSFQRPNPAQIGAGVNQRRHQLQNNSFTAEQLEFLRPGLKLPQMNNVPPEVLALILKSQGADQLINSFEGNNGTGIDQFPQTYQPAAVSQQQIKSNQGSDWGNIPGQNSRNNGGRSNEFTSPLGTSSWGPPPGSQQPFMNTNASVRPDQLPTSQRNQPQSLNSSRNYNISGSNSVGQENPSSNLNLENKVSAQWCPSPNATEFVPKSQSPSGSGIDTEALVMAIAQFNLPEQGQQPEYQETYEDEFNQENFYEERDGDCGEDLSVNEEYILQTVTDSINELCTFPAQFNRCLRKMTAALKQHLCNLETLGIVITLLIEQSIATSNFRYSGARLCQAFHQNGIKVGDSTFKKVLLKRCEEEFMNCINQSTRDDESDKRAQGLLMFLGELYVNFRMIVNGTEKPVGVIGQATVELMTFLVQSERQNFENIKSVSQVLKVQKYFRNTQKAAALLEEKGGLKPQLPNATRWTSHRTCLETFPRNRSTYIKIFEDYGDELKNRDVEKAVNELSVLKTAQDLLSQLDKLTAAINKLLGWEFEHSENELVRNQMEALMKELSYILALSNDTRTKSIIENLIEFKKRDWDKSEDSSEENQILSQSPKTNNPYEGGGGPVLYELPDSEDDDIDERFLVLDDEPEGVCSFYDQFVADTEKKLKK